MTEPIWRVGQLLQAYQRQLQDTKHYTLNFESEGMVKVRKLARLEGELAGVQAAIEIVDAIGTGTSGTLVAANLLNTYTSS
jgi:hypothetical protein